jgi:hypothetical protein
MRRSLAANNGKPVTHFCVRCVRAAHVRRGRQRFAGSRLQLAGRRYGLATFQRSIASELTNTAIARMMLKKEREEIAMYALTQMSRTTQRTVCTVVSAVIVALWLSLGAYGAETVAHPGYSVTVTQIQ